MHARSGQAGKSGRDEVVEIVIATVEFQARVPVARERFSGTHFQFHSLTGRVQARSTCSCCACTFNLSAKKGNTAMGLFSKDIQTMDDLFVHTLEDIYYAENKIVKSLPEMIEKAKNAQLKQAFQSHLTETKNHVTRLEEVFRMLGMNAQGVDCPAIDGIIDEAEDVAGEVADPQVLDAALIAAAQAVEHYEISRYGTLVTWAKTLGRNDAAQLLQRTLDEEKGADKKLTGLAETSINRQAA
jgi:ferritin-like metal-binding protein YciE